MIGKLPEDLKQDIDQYVEYGRPTGGFLQACIENNLKDAVGRADECNLRLIPEIVSYLHNRTPMDCWGKSHSYVQWINKKHAQKMRYAEDHDVIL